MAMAPRKEPNRTTDTAVLVRLTTEQRTRLDAALARLVAGKLGIKPVMSRFLLDSALAEADRILAAHPRNRA